MWALHQLVVVKIGFFLLFLATHSYGPETIVNKIKSQLQAAVFYLFFVNVTVKDHHSLPIENNMTSGKFRHFKWHDEIRG